MPRAVFLMLDGLRPDAISPERTPHLSRLIEGGASTLAAQSVMPSVTLPCHFSLFHSVPPTRHGISTNLYTPPVRPIKGLVELCEDNDKTCAFVYNWEELRDLSRPGQLSYSWCARVSYDLNDGDRLVTEHAVPLLREGRYDFTFVYLGTIDSAGHFYGWMSDGYLEQVARVDGYVGQLADALTDDAVLLAQADHGGHDRIHGTDLPEDMTIPWLVYGAGVRRGYTIARTVSLLDTAPTLARVLGIRRLPSEWEGSAVDEAFA